MKIFRKDNNKEVIFQQLIQKNGVYYDIHENKPFTGIAFEPLLKANPFDLSKRVAEKTFLDGKLDGLSTWFSPHGKIKLQMQFKKGELHGPCEQFSRSSNEVIVKKQIYKNGTLNGVSEWRRKDDNQLIKIETYVNGLRHGSRIDYHYKQMYGLERGKNIKKQGNYSGNVPDGKWQSYYPGNILKRTGLYKMGKRHGIWQWFYENKWLRISLSYNHGKLHGPITSFHCNSTNKPPVVETKGTYINSKREGLWQRFDPDGKILCKATYKEGAIIEWECFDQLGQPDIYSIPVSNQRQPYIDLWGLGGQFRFSGTIYEKDFDDDIPF